MSELFSVFLPTCSCFGWELCFPGRQPGRKSTTNSSGGRHRHPSSGERSSACGSQWVCTSLPMASPFFVSTTPPFLGTRVPSASHRWCLEPPVSLWWQSSAWAHCWALSEQVGRGGLQHWAHFNFLWASARLPGTSRGCPSSTRARSIRIERKCRSKAQQQFLISFYPSLQDFFPP